MSSFLLSLCVWVCFCSGYFFHSSSSSCDTLPFSYISLPVFLGVLCGGSCSFFGYLYVYASIRQGLGVFGFVFSYELGIRWDL